MNKNKKPWYEDIKDRLSNLDTRETLLQKEVARLSERVDWLIQLRVERRETRFKLIYLILVSFGVFVSILNLILNYLGVIS